MALADMQAAGSNSYVARLLADGRSDAYVRQQLLHRYGPQAANSLDAAIRYGREAWLAGLLTLVGGPDDRLGVGDVPRRAGGGTNWRYYIVYQVTNTGTGQQQYVSDILDSPVSLTNAEIVAGAQTVFEATFGAAAQAANFRYAAGAYVQTDLEVEAVERY